MCIHVYPMCCEQSCILNASKKARASFYLATTEPKPQLKDQAGTFSAIISEHAKGHKCRERIPEVSPSHLFSCAW